MKNNYRKLKFSILLQTVFITALTVLVGGFLLEYFIDGIYNDSFARAFVFLLESLHVEEARAIELYWRIIGDNKIFFMIVGFLGLFALFFYIALTKMMKYLKQVEQGIENIVENSEEPVHLITELRPLEVKMNEIKKELKQREHKAQESEQRKNDLVVFLAHDLKTPLTSIVAYLSMLETHPDMPAEERAKYTHISLEKANRLGELINEFFEITRFNLQDLVLEPVEMNLTRILEQIADELYGVLQEKNLSCQVETPDEEIIIEADADKMARVFDNLLRNAIAYCYRNSVIKIQAFQTEKEVEVIFSNQSDNIAPEKLEKVFEKFFRADESRSSATGGAGLGLAISREIVELHEGVIRAESQNHETRFIVTLPKKKEEEIIEDHTRGGHSFGGRTGRWKGIQRKTKRRDLE